MTRGAVAEARNEGDGGKNKTILNKRNGEGFGQEKCRHTLEVVG